MEPLTISIIAGGIFAGLTGASLAALKGWQGWLELRRFEVTHDTADRHLPPAGQGDHRRRHPVEVGHPVPEEPPQHAGHVQRLQVGPPGSLVQ